MISGGSRLSGGGLAGGVAVARLRALEGEGAGGRSRSLVEQPPVAQGKLTAAGLGDTAPVSMPGADKEIPKEWIEVGGLGCGQGRQAGA